MESAADSLSTVVSWVRAITTRYPSDRRRPARRNATASAASFSSTVRPEAVVPTTPGSRPPCPASMKIIRSTCPCVGAKLTQALPSRPGTEGCTIEPADFTGAAGVCSRFAAAWPAESITREITRASVATSANENAVRSRAEGARRRRVRTGTWREFAIGPRSLAGAPIPVDGLVDPAVLRERDLLVGGGVDVEDPEDAHELLVLPHPHIESLWRDLEREHDRILSQACGGTFDYGNLGLLELVDAEAKDRIAVVAGCSARFILELENEIDSELVRSRADLRSIRLQACAMCGGVGVELDVRGGGAALLRRLPMRFGRCIRGRIRGLDLLQVAVDVTREVAPVHTARHVAELDGNVRCGGGRSPRAPTNRAACAGHEQHGDSGEGCAHAAYCKGRDSGSILLK